MIIVTNLLRRKPTLRIFRNKSQSSSEYCLNLVKKHDYENFLSTILLKNTSRSCALAVRGFNVEVAKIAEQVSQESIGLMRMKFWEDTLDRCYSKQVSQVPQHPVAIELFKAINHSNLTKRHLSNLLNSRKQQLGVSTFNNLEDMEKYAEQSVSSVYYLILEGSGVRNIHADHAASHLGKAQGIVQQLRIMPHVRQLNFLPIPQNMLVKNNVSQEDVLRSKSSKLLSDCIYEIASRAHQHLTKSRSLIKEVPVGARSVLLPAVATSSFLDRLQNVDYDIFHASLKHRPWNLLPQIWIANFRNKY